LAANNQKDTEKNNAGGPNGGGQKALRPRRIGVLALQGAFAEHRRALEALGCTAVEVRKAEELENLDGLIIPGGESTTIGSLMAKWGLMEPLKGKIAAGFPVYGTCAGLILLAKEITGSDQPRLGVMDIQVLRNGYGRQVDSFEADLDIPALGPEPFAGVFIRAPIVQGAGPGVEVLAEWQGKPVLVRQGKLLGSTFHPELTSDLRLHRYFLQMLEE